MILCIDTSTEFSGVTLVANQKSIHMQLDVRHASEIILEVIDSVIQKANIKLADLEGVLVLKGPGSFTGLRIGIAVANQFAHQLNIPIVGLRTEEFYRYQTDESDFFYLQSMNRDQVYVVGFGAFQPDFSFQIISASECHHELSSLSSAQWLGQVSDSHSDQMKDIERIKDTLLPDQMWKKIVESVSFSNKKTYELVEPFYGKDPTITKGKK